MAIVIRAPVGEGLGGVGAGERRLMVGDAPLSICSLICISVLKDSAEAVLCLLPGGQIESQTRREQPPLGPEEKLFYSPVPTLNHGWRIKKTTKPTGRTDSIAPQS